jgi:NitT/TauT family transport system ATP-binding protein
VADRSNAQMRLAAVAPKGASAGRGKVVQINNLAKRFETKSGAVQALEGITQTIESGEFVAVVGPSGCGKSTLLRALCGLEAPTSGSIDWAPGGSGVRPKLGVAFQEHRLLPWLSILDNVALPTLMQKRATKADMDRANDLCALVGLTGFEMSRPAALSGGMRQRASVARALFTDPELLLLDEPFGALDALTREQITADAERIWMDKGFAALLITHSISEAVHLADRVIVMSPRPGRIVADIKIDLPRPRSKALGTAEFAKLCSEIRSHLEI